VPRDRKPYAGGVETGWNLVITPTILLFPLVLGALGDPWLILEYWDFFLLFFGIPYAAAVTVWRYAGKGAAPPDPRAPPSIAPDFSA